MICEIGTAKTFSMSFSAWITFRSTNAVYLQFLSNFISFSILPTRIKFGLRNDDVLKLYLAVSGMSMRQ